MKGDTLYNSKYYKVLGIYLTPPFFQKYLPEGTKFDDFKSNILNKRNKFIHHQNYPITPKMMVLIQDIIHCKLQGHFRKIYLESKVLELLFLQLNQIENHKDPLKLSSREIERMHFARKYIEDNVYTEYAGFSLARIAQQACQTNEFYLKRNFKWIFGTTVFDYIRQLKMEQSKVLIQEQNLTVNEVSEMIGYKNSQHFSTAFKRYFGFMPSQLRD